MQRRISLYKKIKNYFYLLLITIKIITIAIWPCLRSPIKITHTAMDTRYIISIYFGPKHVFALTRMKEAINVCLMHSFY